MSKTFFTKIIKRAPRPRSKRLAKYGATAAATSTVTIVGGESGGIVEGHTHDNKAALDEISTDREGYLLLTQLLESEGVDGVLNVERATARVKAGFADIAADLTEDSPVREQFLSAEYADTAHGKITHEQGADFGDYVSGLSGAGIDSAGNAEVESLTSRSFLKVYELIYNRLNAQEGNTSFADVGTIELVVDNGDGTHTLTMRKRWDGDVTAFQPGDVIYGYVNDLEGEGSYYKAWAWVQSVDRAANALIVYHYADADCPASVNHPLAAGMVVTRWGNNIEATEATYNNPDYQGVVIVRRGAEYRNIRQTTFYISCDDGNIVELMGVHKPILDPENYGTIIGKIPDGLLDSATEELINKDQPYLFARGIIVQDLIRIDYHGVVTRTANYRGTWSADTASSAEEYYRSTMGAYDTVTWRGCLWQCITQGNTDEPGTSGAWLCMAGDTDGKVQIWTLMPTANIVSIRADRIEPQTLSCVVNLHSTLGDRRFTDNVTLLNAGARLYYSLDGEILHEFTIGTTEPLELEDGSGNVELEASAGGELYITVGGDDIDTADIDDRIYFILKDADTGDVLAQTIVPVVRDGADGKDGIEGRDGLMVYPAGYYDRTALYTATSDTAPVVMYCAEGRTAPQERQQFYVLKRGREYCGITMGANRNTPALDIANGGEDARWERFDKFNAIFASIIMADFAKLSSAVFYGDWMISQQGVLADGTPSTDYEGFRTGDFTPNFAVNFRTGEMSAGSGTFSGYIQTRFIPIGESDGTPWTPSEAPTHIVAPRHICKRINADRSIQLGENDEIVLPSSAAFIGARVSVCENTRAYSRSSEPAVITTEDGSPIYGIMPEGEPITHGSKYVRLLNGIAEFVCVPKSGADGTEWLVANHCATSFYGQN